MSCCAEKIKIERLKTFRHASVLACQQANITNTKIAVIIKEHKSYGKYYEGIEFDKAKETGDKIYITYKKGDKAKKIPKSVKYPVFD